MRISCFVLAGFVCLYLAACTDKAPASDTQPVITVKIEPDSVQLRRADSLFKVAEKYNSKNNKDSSLIIHQQVLAIREKLLKEDLRLVESYYAVGRFYLSELKYDIADKYFEKGRILSDRVNVPPGQLVECYLQSINCKIDLLDFSFSNSLILHVLHLTNSYFSKDKVLRSRIYQSQANNYYYHGHFNKAFEFLNKSIQLIPNNDHKRLSTAFYNMAAMMHGIKESKKALHYFDLSMSERLKWASPNSDPIAAVYLQKAFVLNDLGLRDSAKYYLIKNLEIRRKVYGEKDAHTFGAKYELAKFNYSNGSIDSAAKYYQECLVSLVKSFNQNSLFNNPKPDQTELNTDLIRGLVGKAKVLKMLGINQQDFLLASLKTLMLADSVFSVYRANFLYDDPQLKQLELGYIPYHEIVDISFKLYDQTSDPHFINTALIAIERSRAVLLQDYLQKVEAYNLAGVELAFKKRERQLLRDQTELIRSISNSDLPEHEMDSLNEALLSVMKDVSNLQYELKGKNPNYFDLRYSNQQIDLSSLQKFLMGRNSALLQYLWSDSSLYVLMVNPKKVRIKKLIQSEALNKVLLNYSMELRINQDQAIQKEHFQDFCVSANTLYRLLISDMIEDIDTQYSLIISANGPLSLIPFEAFITKSFEGNEVDYRLPYLVNDMALSYAYSAGVLMRQNAQKRQGDKLLAFGYAGSGPSNFNRDGFENLPGTEKELQAVKEIMKNGKNEYHLEMDASESTFKRKAFDFDIVHLAVHGVADTTNALESRLVFRNDSDSLEDGKLFAHELYDLDLSGLDLAVLSACESGIGKQQAGEGVMSIARGFAYAGCPSLVMSLWKINDDASAQVMSNFYQHLSKANKIDQALARAKKDYLTRANEFKSHPFYWSAFLQVGDSKALDTSQFYYWKRWGLVAVILIIVLGLLIKRKMQFKATE